MWTPTCPENPTSHSLRQFFTAYRSAPTQSLTNLPNYLPVALRELILAWQKEKKTVELDLWFDFFRHSQNVLGGLLVSFEKS
jgi:hypothetical protein